MSALGGSGRCTREGRLVERVALLIRVAVHTLSRADERSESLDSFYGLKLEVTRNKSYLDV